MIPGWWRRTNLPLKTCGVFLLLIIAISIVGPLLSRYNPDVTVGSALQSPSWSHLFGTDELGRDVFTRTLYGMRFSIVVALLTAVLGGATGTAIGLTAGYYSGRRDSALMAAIDFMLAFPPIVIAMILVAIIGAGRATPIIAAVLVAIPLFARVVRGSTLAERNKEYVIAAKALGANDGRVIFRTLLSSVTSVVWAQAAIAAALGVQLEAALSYLGMGVPPPAPSLGGMLQSAQSFLYNAPYYAVLPGLVLTGIIALFIIAASLLNSRVLSANESPTLGDSS